MKPYCVVRTGPFVRPDGLGEWNTIVHRCQCAHGVQSYRVCLHGATRTVIVEHFDVHCGRYDSEQEETRVSLSAVGHACRLAAVLDENEDKVAFWLRNN